MASVAHIFADITRAGATQLSISATIGALQIDNHLPLTPYPVLLHGRCPTPADQNSQQAPRGSAGGKPTSTAATPPPFLRIDLGMVLGGSTAAAPGQNQCQARCGAVHVTHAIISMNDVLDIFVDETVVVALQNFADRMRRSRIPMRSSSGREALWPLPLEAFTSLQPNLHGREPTSLAPAGHSGIENRGAVGDRWVYFHVLSVQTMRVSVSVQRPRESPDDVVVGFKVCVMQEHESCSDFKHSYCLTCHQPGRIALDLMMRIDGAKFKLDHLLLRHSFLTTSDLSSLVRRHYTRSLKKHVLSTIGSLQVMHRIHL